MARRPPTIRPSTILGKRTSHTIAASTFDNPESTEIPGILSKISRNIRSGRIDTGPNSKLNKIEHRSIKKAPATNLGVSCAGAAPPLFRPLFNLLHGNDNCFTEGDNTWTPS